MNIKEWAISNLLIHNRLRYKISNYINKEYACLIEEETFFLKSSALLQERIYCIVNNITSIIICNNEKCNNPVNFNSFSKGYYNYCSNKCVSGSKDVIEKTKQSYLKKYGVENIFESEEIKNKIKQVNIKRYGTEYSIQSEEIKNKIKKTHLEKYGVIRASKLDSIKEKSKKINLEKYGVEYTGQILEAQKKRKQTNIQKYGYFIPTKNEIVKNKIIDTKKKKYGFVSPHRISHISKENIAKLSNKEWLYNQHVDNQISCCGIAKKLNVGSSFVRDRLLDYNIDINNYSHSSYEKEIIKFINIENIKTNNRNIISPYELDIYILKYKLAIEFNGLYWHSKHDKNYHLNKTEMCREKEIQLLHIFENEWLDPIKQDIWKSIINNKLGRNNKIHARKTKIIEIKDNKLVKEFLDNNHIQGHCPCSIKLGLFYDNELVSIMIFGKTRFSKKYEYEMTRFCNKKFTSVIGGASKLYKHFVNIYNPKSIISYVDRRYSNGSLYEKLGFELSHYSNPNYWYFKRNNLKLYSRVKFQKHKLKDMLENFDETKSEIKNMANNNYSRIFDCGNIIYTWKSNP